MQGKSYIRHFSHLQTAEVHVEKPNSSCTSPGAKAVSLCSDCFGWQLLPKEKKKNKKNLLCPSPPILWAVHIQGVRLLWGLSASSSAGQDRVP